MWRLYKVIFFHLNFQLKKKIVSNTKLRKIIVIFTIAFISRVVINNIFDTNVFTEYLSLISLSYYSCMAIFTYSGLWKLDLAMFSIKQPLLILENYIVLKINF
jgi:hypothetical protein